MSKTFILTETCLDVALEMDSKGNFSLIYFTEDGKKIEAKPIDRNDVKRWVTKYDPIANWKSIIRSANQWKKRQVVDVS